MPSALVPCALNGSNGLEGHNDAISTMHTFLATAYLLEHLLIESWLIATSLHDFVEVIHDRHGRNRTHSLGAHADLDRFFHISGGDREAWEARHG